jgi:hypothetical protein
MTCNFEVNMEPQFRDNTLAKMLLHLGILTGCARRSRASSVCCMSDIPFMAFQYVVQQEVLHYADMRFT